MTRLDGSESWSPRFFLFVATEGEYVHICIYMCRSRRSGLKYGVPSRYMHLFNAVRAIPLGRKSVTRNGWANFLFRSAPGLVPLLYSYTIHQRACISNIYRRAYIHRKVHGQEIPRVGAREPKITNEGWHGWERRARTRCWFYQQALDLDEVKYKLSLLASVSSHRHRDCVFSGSSSNFSIIYRRFWRRSDVTVNLRGNTLETENY